MDSTLEKFWTPDEIAERWRVSIPHVIRILERHAGVVNLGNIRSKRRTYRVFRCPDNVLRLIEQSMSIQ